MTIKIKKYINSAGEVGQSFGWVNDVQDVI